MSKVSKEMCYMVFELSYHKTGVISGINAKELKLYSFQKRFIEDTFFFLNRDIVKCLNLLKRRPMDSKLTVSVKDDNGEDELLYSIEYNSFEKLFFVYKYNCGETYFYDCKQSKIKRNIINCFVMLAGMENMENQSVVNM